MTTPGGDSPQAPPQGAGDYFDINGIMKQFYNYKPKKKDAAGRAMKHTFQANMIQSAFDTATSKELAEFQTGLSQDTMAHAAELEMGSLSANMQQEYNLGIASMERQMALQNKYADDQSARDITLLGATGEQERKNIVAAGEMDAIKMIKQGEQARETDTNRLQVAGKEQRASDQSRIASEGIEQRAGIRTTGEQERENISSRGTEERKGIQEKGKVETALERVRGFEQREGIKETGAQQRAGITTTGEQERKNISSRGAEERKGY